MKVLGIDPGLRNMAFCFMVDGKPKILDRRDIFDGKEIVVKDTFDRVMKFMDDIQPIIDDADVVLVEKQFADNKLALSTCLIVIQTVVQTLCRTKCVVVHALAIKRVYGTSMGDYRQNKLAAIRKALELCPEVVSMFPKKKVDDVSDAFLLSHFGTFHLGSIFSQRGGKETNTNVEQREHRTSYITNSNANPKRKRSPQNTPDAHSDASDKEECECIETDQTCSKEVEFLEKTTAGSGACRPVVV